MKTKTEKLWAARVEAWQASGQTARRFSEGKGFAPSTLAFWKSKLKRKKEVGPAIVFARVERSEPVRRPAVVLFGEARIEVFADTDEEALGKAVRALRGSR